MPCQLTTAPPPTAPTTPRPPSLTQNTTPALPPTTADDLAASLLTHITTPTASYGPSPSPRRHLSSPPSLLVTLRPSLRRPPAIVLRLRLRLAQLVSEYSSSPRRSPPPVASSPLPRPLCCGSLIRRQPSCFPGRPCFDGASGALAPPSANTTRQRYAH